jgi:hypothetical protein
MNSTAGPAQPNDLKSDTAQKAVKPETTAESW